jgi:autotransporter-associated beta strand protein
VVLFVLLASGSARADESFLVSNYLSDSGSTSGTLRYAVVHGNDETSNTISFGLDTFGGYTINLGNGALSVLGPLVLRNNWHSATVNQDGFYQNVFDTNGYSISLDGSSDLSINIVSTHNLDVSCLYANSASGLNIGDIGDNVTLSATGTAADSGVFGLLSRQGNITITGEMAGTISATASGSGLNAWGMRSGLGVLTQYSITIEGALSGAVNASAGEGGNAYGLQGDYVTIDTMSGDITASAGASAYGLMASDGYANYSELIIGTLSGTVVATGTTGHAYGLYGENNVKITGDLTSIGKITATAGQAAYGIYAAVDDIIISGRLAGDVKASAANAYGLYAARGLTISNGVAAAGSVTATGTTLAQGMGSNTGPLTIANGFAGSVMAEVTGVGAAYGLKGPGIGLTGGLSGAVASTAFGAGQAYGLWAGGGGISIDSVSSTGTVTATVGDSGYAYGLYGSSGDVSITGAMSGQITATAGDSGYAYGLYVSSGDISITGGMSGAIAATAGDDGKAYGMYADGGSISITGGVSETITATVTGATTSSGNAYGLWASAGITIDSVSATGKVTATSTELGAAYGLCSSNGSIQITSGLAGSISAAAGIALGLYASGGVTLASLSGSVTAAGDFAAYGLQSSTSISITGALSGTVTAKTTYDVMGYAAGLYAATTISIGEVRGTISATTAGTAAPGSTYAYGLYAGGNINGGDADTALLVSGTISARAYGRAYAVYSTSGAVNLYVTGALEGVNTHDSEAYAIYAGGSGSSVTLDLAGDASTSLVGKVHLNGGSLTLLGVNSADNLFEGVTDLVVGNGSAAASWTLDPGYANRSSFTNLTIKTNASLSINEFVSITNSIDNDGSLTWDTVDGSKTYAGVLSGSGSLTKKGDYTLTLSGRYNDYSGTTTVSEGTLQAGVAGAFSSSSAVSVASGATLALNNFNQTIAGLSGGGDVTLGSATLTVQNAASHQFDGVISGTGGLTKSGSGTLTLAAANTYTGATTVNAGTLRAGAADIIASSSGLSVASGAVFDLNGYDQTFARLSGSGGVTLGSDAATVLTLNLGSTDSTFAGVISGAGGLTKTGSATLTLSGANTYAGATTISGGILRLTGSLASASIDLASGTGIVFAAASDTTYAGAVTGSGTLTKSGTAALTLSGANTYTGDTTISGGTLRVTGSLASQSVAVASGALLDMRPAANATYAGVISGAGGFQKSGAAALTLSGDNTYTGATTVAGGTLNVTGSLATSSISVAAGATLDFSGSLTNLSSLSNAGTINLSSALTFTDADCTLISTGSILAASSTDVAILFGAGDDSATFGPGAMVRGIVDGGGGDNTLTLVGSVSLDGEVRNFQSLVKQDAGSWTIGGDVDLGTGTLTVSQGTLTLEGGLTASGAAIASGGLLEWSPSADTGFAGVIEGAGDFQKSGAATLTLSGDNTYTGATTVSGGILRLTGSLASSSIDLASGTGIVFAAASDTTYAGAVTGSGTLTKSGTATLTLSGVNTYTGDTTVSGGTLRVTGSLASQSVAVASGALLDMSPAADATYAGVISGAGGFRKSGAAVLTLSGDQTYTGDTDITAGTLRVTGSLASQGVGVATGALLDMSPATAATYAGVISGAGGFRKSGAAMLTLSGNQTYTGDTAISAGTLRVTGSLASQSVDVASGALFDLSPSADTTYAGVISGAGNFQKSGAAVLTLSGANTYTGDTDITVGTLRVTGSLASASVAIADGALFDMSPAANTTFSGVISGAGDFRKTGAAVLTLSGANTYTGDTTISGGTLRVTGSLASQSVAVASGALLDMSPAANATYAGVISGAGGFQKSGAAALTLSGNNTYTGATTVAGGTLNVTGSLATSSINVAAGATLDFSGSLTNLSSLSNAGTINLSSALTFTDADCTLISTGSILAASSTDVAILFGAGDDSATFGPGAMVRGIVDGGGGDNTLTLVGSVSLDGEVRNFQSLVKQDAGSWTIGGDVDLGTGTLTVSEGTLTLEGGLTASGAAIASGGLLDWAPSSDTGFAGVISGAGDFQKSGAAALTLSGDNTYTGATTITGGTLIVTGSLASLSVDVAAGALFDMSPATDTTYAGVISGAGDFQKSGAAMLTLSGDQTYTGDTTISGGTLRVIGSLGSQSVDVAAGALFDMRPAADATYAGVISGAGDFQKSGAATLTLSGDQTYTGDTMITAGILRLTGSLASQSVAVADGTLFDFSPATDTTYAGVISGAGTFLKSGTATLTLSGDSTNTGATWVMEGLLDVTGALASHDYQIDAGAGIRFASNASIDGDAVVNGTWTSPLLTVGSTGTLMGVGTINGDVESHGVIAPGLSAGTLTINGDLLLGSGSLLNLEITPTASDLLHVTGATTISGGSLHVAIASGYYTSGQQFTLLSSDGGLTGDYQTITIDNRSSFLRFSVENTDTATVGTLSGSASVVRLPYAIAATTRNSYGASLGLTGATLAATPAMQSVLAKIDFMTLAEAEQGMRQMSPEPYSALVETSFAAMRLFSDTIRERAYATRGGGESVLAMVPGGEMSRMTELASREIGSDAPTGITAKSGTAGGLGLFVKPVGQYVNFDSAKNRTGFQSWQYGMVAGGDLAVNDNLLAGFQVGYVHSDLSFSDTATSTGRSDTFLGGLYASYASGGFYADGLVQAGAAWNRLVRKIEFGSISSQPEGTYVSFLFGGSLTTGYDWTFGTFKAGPVATLDYGYVAVPGFSETGDAELGLSVRDFSGNSLKTGLGAKVSGTFTAGEKTTISPDVSLRWGHEFLDDSQNVKARFNGSPTSSFSAKTGDPARDNLLVDAGVSLGVSDSTKLYLRYSGQLLGQGTQTQAGAVGVRYEF